MQNANALRPRDGEAGREPIAIIGIGCRFPGADGPESFWRLLTDGIDAIREVPAERFDIDAVYDPRPGIPGKLVSREGGFLHDVDQFAAAFFGISPREAVRVDPQQRILLEVAWEALEDAGQVPGALAGSMTGVFMGLCYTDYEDLTIRGPADMDIYGFVGFSPSILSGRLSYALNLRGPSLTLDTACSSSLVATHLACESLWSGESTLALAGGVNLILQPKYSFGFSKAGMLAPDGRCKFGDASANGFVRSDGIGVLVLKPLSRAQADGDPIHAVICGTAVNNDGRCSGLLMTPARQGQEDVVAQAYRRAGISPSEVQYVEAHGTGTSVGDPIEMKALGTIVQPGRLAERPCIVGSVKSNIGHTEAAAGVAGIIKTALALQHGTIPKSLHFHNPNPDIPWSDLPLVVQEETGPWPDYGVPRIAGVSSFGIGGTNAHIVLREAPPSPAAAAPRRPTSLLTLSAENEDALEEMALSYVRYLGEAGADEDLHDICFTAGVRRTHHAARLAVVGETRDELIEGLQAHLQGDVLRGTVAGRAVPDARHKLVFIFPGQGSQWIGMGRELLEREEVFRRSIERSDEAIHEETGWSLLEQLQADPETARMDDIDVVQPALFAIEVALAELWRSWGIEPDVVIGHSMGEVAAALVAGALSLEDAVRIICRRSKLMRGISGRGAMASVELSWDAAQAAIRGYEDRVSIAVSNSPTSTVLSGEPAALGEILAELEARDIFCRLVKVDVASHSPQVDELRSDLLEALAGITPRAACLPMYSTVTARPTDGGDLDTEYWVRNLREPVRFADVVETLLAGGHDMFLEMSPNPILLGGVQGTARQSGREVVALPSLRRDDREQAALLTSLGTLYTAGYPVAWERLYPSGARCVALPRYTWQRERLMHAAAPDASAGRRGASGGHPLLGQHTNSAAHAGMHFWEMDLGLDSIPYLGDHRVQGTPVLPAAAYVEAGLAAARALFGAGSHSLEGLTLSKALFLPDDGYRTVQIVVSRDMPDSASIQFFSAEGSGSSPESWTLHAHGTLRAGSDEETLHVPAVDLDAMLARCTEVVSDDVHYGAMRDRGLDYGPNFQGVEEIWRRPGEALGRIQATEAAADPDAYLIHPALLDACFQVSLSALDQGDGVDRGTYLPVSVGTFRLFGNSEEIVWSHVTLLQGSEVDSDVITADLTLLNGDGDVLASVEGFRAQRLDGGGAIEDAVGDWLYTMRWEPADPPSENPEHELRAQPTSWLIFTDAGSTGARLAEKLRQQQSRCVLVAVGDRFEAAGPDEFRIDPNDAEDYSRLLHEAWPANDLPHEIVHLWGADAVPTDQLDTAILRSTQVIGSISVVNLVRAIAAESRPGSPRLSIVTRGAHVIPDVDVDGAPAQAPLYGLGRVLVNEHPELRSRRVDLALNGDRDGEVGDLLRELLWDDVEDEVAWRDSRRFAHRLSRYSADEVRGNVLAGGVKTVIAGADQPFRLDTLNPGVLDNLILRATVRRDLGPKEVEIKVFAAALNFRDVLSSMGMLAGYRGGVGPLGCECAGVITAVGEDVEEFQIGDEVIAFGNSTAFSAFAVTYSDLVVRKPESLTFEEAASIPVIFLTSYYAMNYLARMDRGDRVLIHAAAGGVGVAAVQLAQLAGAEIFATASSPEKHEFLRSLGVKHIMNSRTLDFADKVMELTDGEGVDIVLNSLAGEFIPKSFSILAPSGRFLEIGRRDIYNNSKLGMEPFKRNLSFFAVDLSRLAIERPALIGRFFREIVQFVATGQLKPPPMTVFPIENVVDAFRYMAQAKHIGKIVVSVRDHEVPIVPALSRDDIAIRANATYAITGGLGGLGLTIAQWLVEQGARHLVLVGRRGATPESEDTLRALREAGAEVAAVAADISDEAQVIQLLAEIDRAMPPLRGVIHAAAVLDDGIVLQQDRERFERVMAPKMLGAWNLHTHTKELPLDFFVLFSSAASLFGSPGQSNYVAANEFLDVLAQYRRARGLPATSVNWGPWSEVGLAARPDRGGRLALRGMDSLSPQEGLEALAEVLVQDVAQIGVLKADWRRWGEYYPALAGSPLLSELIGAGEASPSGAESGWIREQIVSLEPDMRQQAVEAHLGEQAAKVLGLSAAKLDPSRSLPKMGLDSLMAVELKNLVETGFGIDMPVTKLLQDVSIDRVAADILQQMLSGGESRRDIVAEQGLVTGPVPLLPRQHHFFEGRTGRPELAAPPRLVEVQETLDPEVLEEAFAALFHQHDAMRARFVQKGGVWTQTIAAREEHRVLQCSDLRALGEVEQELAIKEAVAELRSGLNLADGPLMRVALFDLGPDKPSRLLFVMHHLVFDGMAGRIIVQDLETAYRQLSDGGPVALPAKTTSVKYWAERLMDFAQSDEVGSEATYWLAPERMDLVPLPVDHQEPPAGKVRGRPLTTALSQEETQALLREVPLLHGTEINDALVAALVLTMGQWTGQSSLLMDLSSHGREEMFPDVDLSRTVGWFTTVVPTLVTVRPGTAPADALQQVRNQLRAVPNRGLGYGLLRYLREDPVLREQMMQLPRPQVALNYQGQLDPMATRSTMLDATGIWNRRMADALPGLAYNLSLVAQIIGEQLRIDFVYREHQYDRQTVEQLAEQYMDNLRSFFKGSQSLEAAG